MGNSALNLIYEKMYASLVLSTCIVALLCYPLPGELSLRDAAHNREPGRPRVPPREAGPCHGPMRIP